MAGTEYYSELAIRAITDPGAFEELYLHFFPRVYNFIFARLKDSDDADDVTSETFMKMNENLKNYNPAIAAFSTWLFRIANNALIDHTRHGEKSHETEWEEFFYPTAPESQEPERHAIENEANRELLEALDKLSERERRIVELRYWGENDTRTIAELLNMGESNVRVTLHRALNKLKKFLGEV